MPRYLKHIIDAAEIAEHSQQEIKHGAVLVRGGKVIGRGCNSDRSRMRALSGGGANMVALHSERFTTHRGVFYEADRARKKMKHCDLYVVRLLPAGRKIQGSSAADPSVLGNSKPCARCLQALDAAGVRRVVYTTGKPPPAAGEIDVEIRTVDELIREQAQHSSRGDAAAAARPEHATSTAGARRKTNGRNQRIRTMGAA